MTRLLIAEKPSVARDLARVIGAKTRRQGYIEGQGWLITWCIGHLVELVEPHEYTPDWKRWNLATLPMLPEQFKLRPVRRTADQFQVVKALLHRADLEEVINGCDAGREGELIFRYVYHLARATRPIRRLWISSMTDQAIQEGLRALRPGADHQNLYEAARCRSEADWLVGLNATRAITVRSRQGMPFRRDAPLYSVGRVQTPTLALMVDREHEITAFTPQDYWEIEVTFQAAAGTYTGKWFTDDPRPPPPLGAIGEANTEANTGANTEANTEANTGANTEATTRATTRATQEATTGAALNHSSSRPAASRPRTNTRLANNRFWLEEEAEAIRQKVMGQTGRITALEQKRSRQAPPLLFDLTRLQRTANKRYGFPAARTLEIAQALYERHKLLTYPRTDSTHLSRDMVPKLKASISAVAVDVYRPFCDQLLALPKLPISKRFVDDTKVSDHHAIIPTPVSPRLDSLSPHERKIYDLVVRRFLGIFFPDALFDKTRVVSTVAAETFLTRGKVLVDVGWRAVAGFEDEAKPGRKKKKPVADDRHEQEEEEEDQGVLPPLKKGEDTRALEATVLEKQTKPSPRFTEASLLAAMEGAGKLIDEDEFQQAMKDKGLGTPATRAAVIETLLRRGFLQRQKKALHPTEMGIRLIAAVPVESLRSPQLTGEWEARLAQMARGEYEPRRFMLEVRAYVQTVVDRIRRAAPIQEVAGSTRLSSPSANPASKRRGSKRGGTPGPAGAAGEHKPRGQKVSGKPAASSPRKPSKAKGENRPGDPAGTLGRCPICDGPVLATAGGFQCAHQGRGCGFIIRSKIAGKKISLTMATQLLTKGRTRLLKGFVSHRTGVKFNATLFVKPNGGIGFEFENRSSPGVKPASVAKGSFGACPVCGEGTIIRGKRAWGCSNWRTGCRCIIPFEVSGQQVTEGQLGQLLSTGRSAPIQGARQPGSRPGTFILKLTVDHSAGCCTLCLDSHAPTQT